MSRVNQRRRRIQSDSDIDENFPAVLQASGRHHALGFEPVDQSYQSEEEESDELSET